MNIVKDPNQAGAAVVNGISCRNCHYSGMLRKTDQIRPLAERGVFAEADADRIKARYPPKAIFDALLKEAEDRFARAVEETGAAVTPSEPILLLARQFETELDLPLAAAESGFQVEEFQKLIVRSNRLAQRLRLLLVPGGPVKRDAFVSTLPLIVADGRSGAFLPYSGVTARPIPSSLSINGSTPGETRTIQDGNVEVVFCWCPPTTIPFKMGSPESEPDHRPDEAQVAVTLIRGFWIMKTEVTQELYEAIGCTNKSYFKGPKLPVENVTYDEAIDCAAKFIRKLRDAVLFSGGEEIRPLTEAQWDYAARAGSEKLFPFGDSLDANQANFGENLDKTTNVGSYRPDDWNLVDTVGNVSEWTLDAYKAKLPGGVDPFVAGDPGSTRVIRGGGWHNAARHCRAAYRGRITPPGTGLALGLRLTRVQAGK